MATAEKLSVTQDRLVRLFVAIGLKAAGSWDAARLRKKTKQLAKGELTNNETKDKLKTKDVELSRLLDDILAADPTDIEVTGLEEPEEDDDDSDEEEETPKKKKGKKGTKVKEKKKKAARESTVEKDEFGTRVGTQAAKMNAVLLKGKPLTVAELAEKASAPVSAANGHVRAITERGFVTRDKDKKLVLTKTAKKKAS